MAEDGKGTGTNSGKSGMRNLEAKSIRSKVGSKTKSECVKLKTVTKVGWTNVWCGRLAQQNAEKHFYYICN